MGRYGVGNELEQSLKLCTDMLSNGSSMIIPMFITNLNLIPHAFVIVANKKDDEISFKVFDPSKALQLENKEKLEQQFGNYIYNHLDKEYILSPKERIQNALIEHNPLFRPTCTGISTEYINYIIDKKQDKNPEKLTAKQGKEIQERYAKHIVENGLHHIILGEQQIEQQAVKQETKPQDKPSVEEKKTTVEDKPLSETKQVANNIITVTRGENKATVESKVLQNTQIKSALPRPPKKRTIPENKSLQETKQVKQDEIVDKKPISTSTTINKKDPEPQDKPSVEKKTTTLENKPQDKPSVEENKATVESKVLQETKQVKQDEVVDKKEVKPEAVSIAVNDTDKKPIQEEITVRNAPVETPKEYPIETKFVDNKLNMDLIKHKEEEQKKKETGSIIPALQDVDKVQTHKENKEESGTFNLLSDILRNKEKDNKEQKSSSKKDNRDQEQETVKDSGLTERKSNQIYK